MEKIRKQTAVEIKQRMRIKEERWKKGENTLNRVEWRAPRSFTTSARARCCSCQGISKGRGYDWLKWVCCLGNEKGVW